MEKSRCEMAKVRSYAKITDIGPEVCQKQPFQESHKKGQSV